MIDSHSYDEGFRYADYVEGDKLGGVPMSALFFAISNPAPKAIGLATKIADHILKTGRSSQVRPR
jgi:hypothetical protein